jgi:hypothetical protein
MIVTMAYGEDLANRIRRPDGGGVSGEGGLMIHCSKEETEALLAKPGCATV